MYPFTRRKWVYSGLSKGRTMHRIEKSLLGKQTVHYQCPVCQGELISPLEDAGKADACPTCGGKLRVPGIEELEQHRRQQEVTRQKHEQERRTAVTLTARAKLEADRQAAGRVRQREREEFVSGKKSLSSADKVLAVAFGFGKLVSIVAVISCFAVIIGAVVWMLTLREAPPLTTVLPVTAPTLAEYAKFSAAASSYSRPSGTLASGASTADSERQQLVKWIASATTERSVKDEIVQVYDKACIYELGGDFFDGLIAFIQGPPKPTDVGLLWYATIFEQRIDSYSRSIRNRAEEQQAARAVLTSQRTLTVMVMGMALAALLAFLVLPLLILIEENTRRLRATAALAAVDREIPAA